MKSINKFIADFLQKKKLAGAHRKLVGIGDGIDFLTNDYLNLSKSSELKLLLDDELKSRTFKAGSSGSRLLGGNSNYIEEVEEYLAGFYQAEASLILSSGYQANLAVLSCLPQRGDTVFYDELSHACMKDGIRLNFAESYSFKHNDYNDLERKIEKFGKGRLFIVAESVYSMDGDFVDLKRLVDIAERFDAGIILDEAHTTAWYGDKGKGLAINEGLENRLLARIYTYGKGPGAHGAVVAGSSELTEFMINHSRPFIYTTAPPDHQVALIKCSTLLFSSDYGTQKRNDLHSNMLLFSKIAGNQDWENEVKIIESNSPIKSIVIPGNDRVEEACKSLRIKNIEVRPVKSPTVKKGLERIRICLHSDNTEKEIIKLIDELKTLNCQ
ncbi:aminotransferase class I/II-fold pyridoxal phosphate-dependent enzyme [Mangrovivirga sp. M17]|uniref:Aminotransferase class I/II-fold pyridoxal phosphate-dependent enzyme n=1 Tax=Mangrovivirga halotolerans TaxID=2993936 RepID=A0ABT3RL37_9BACT|nr:aminotransferase class I/II-fold pyridoxal phosphate-dependent enzyme [Mangrovivirga halotolerans]MCX2742532.1 aminotransferase class I/II-fold pyridoxal phosphate-dependent enzyme [Mangrovivirga halotolerans]